MRRAGNWPSLGSKSVRLSLERVLLRPGAFLQVIFQRLFALRRLEAESGSRSKCPSTPWTTQFAPWFFRTPPWRQQPLGVVAGGIGSLEGEASGGQGVHSACNSPRLRPVALDGLRASPW